MLLVASPSDRGKLSTAANSEGLTAIEEQRPHGADVQAHGFGYLAVVVAGRNVVHGHTHWGVRLTSSRFITYYYRQNGTPREGLGGQLRPVDTPTRPEMVGSA